MVDNIEVPDDCTTRNDHRGSSRVPYENVTEVRGCLLEIEKLLHPHMLFEGWCRRLCEKGQQAAVLLTIEGVRVPTSNATLPVRFQSGAGPEVKVQSNE